MRPLASHQSCPNCIIATHEQILFSPLSIVEYIGCYLGAIMPRAWRASTAGGTMFRLPLSSTCGRNAIRISRNVIAFVVLSLSSSSAMAGSIYGIQPNGDLLAYKHAGTADGSASWAYQQKKVGNGWNGFVNVFAGDNGVIYGIQPNGDLLD